MQEAGSRANSFKGRVSFGFIDGGVGNQPRHRFAVPGDDDLLALLDAVEKGAQGVFGFEGLKTRES